MRLIKKLAFNVGLVAIFVGRMWGQVPAPTTISLGEQPLPVVTQVGTSFSGTAGNNTYCYWVVAEYAIGNAAISAPSCRGGVGTGTVTVTWQAPATVNTLNYSLGYDVIRTTSNVFNQSCTACLLTNSTTGLSTTDNLGTLALGYAINQYGLSNAVTSIDNTSTGNALMYTNQNGVRYPSDSRWGATLPTYCNVGDSFYLVGTGPYFCATANTFVSITPGTSGLTTIGAVPFVTSPGILGQDPADFFWDATNNRLGIGTATPTATLQVAGDALINNLTVGLGTGSVATNTVVGYQATLNNVSGSNVTAIGYQALQNIITNANSVAVGYQALANLTNGVNAFGAIVGGSGYVDGTYTPVQLIFSSGTTATTYPTVTIVVAGGVVTSVTKLTTGTGFRDTTTVMTATAASIGGTGTGFTVATATRTGNATSTAVGYQALKNSTTGGGNNAFGTSALGSNTTGSSNTAIGGSALANNTTGSNNLGVGAAALLNSVTGSNNTAIGSVNPLFNNTTGSNNTAIGYQVLFRNTTGSDNIAIGTNAGRYTSGPADNNATSSSSIYIGNTTGAFADGQTNQIVIGEGAIGAGSNTVTLGHTTIATTILRGNVGIGTAAPTKRLTVVGGDALINTVTVGQGSATSGYQNTALGASALVSNTSGSDNTAVGNVAGSAINIGTSNTVIGSSAGSSVTSGSWNTFIGRGAGNTLTTGSNNIYLGGGSAASSASVSDEVVIGYAATGKGANTAYIAATTVYLGASTIISSVGNLGIGTTTPVYGLDVAKSGASGTARFYDQTATTGATGVTITRGAAQTGASTLLSVNGVVAFTGDNTGGAGTALLGSNSPAVTNTAPYTWIKIRTADNSVAYIPAWK